jgi:hypothetical protein
MNLPFLIVMFIIVTVFVIAFITGIIILTFLNKKEKQVPPAVNSIIATTGILITSLFCYAFNNVIFGYFLCSGPDVSDASTAPYPPITLDCNSSARIVLTILSIVAIIIHTLPTILIRLFIFYFDIRDNDLFVTQSGFFSAFQYTSITILQFIAIFLKAYPIISSIVGMLIFVLFYLFILFF